MSAASSSSSHPPPPPPPLPSLRCSLGPYLWRADFDSANLKQVQYVGSHPLDQTTSPALLSTPDIFHIHLSPDPMSNYRVWFHFSVVGLGVTGKPISIVIKNWNNKKPLIQAGMRPIYRLASQTNWKRVQGIESVTLTTGEKHVQSFLRPAESATAIDAPNDDDDDAAQPDEEGDDGSSSDGESASAVPASGSTSSSTPAPASSSRKSKSGSSSSKSKKVKHDTMELTIKHTFESDEEVFFAFCLPYSYTQIQSQLMNYERRFAHTSATSQSSSSSSSSPPSPSSIYFHRELLIHSLCGRRIDLVTITSNRGREANDATEPDIPHLYPTPTHRSSKSADIRKVFSHDPDANTPIDDVGSSSLLPESRCASFTRSKPIVFLSSRVHPGESPASWILHGCLEWLVSNDPRAIALRDAVVFKIVPCLNPDGVAYGYYRTDTLGQNLNRFYEIPTFEQQPSIYAVRRLIESYHHTRNVVDGDADRLFFYGDLHAHASKRGLFIFGNHLLSEDPETLDTNRHEFESHLRNISYAKLVQLNSPFLHIPSCNFTRQNMHAKDARDGLSKSGSGRVALYHLTRMRHCYTIEVNYHNGPVTMLAPLPTVPNEPTTIPDHNSTTTVTPSASPSASSSSSSSSYDLSWQKDEYHLTQESSIGPPIQFGVSHFTSMGRSLLISILDLFQHSNVWSRLPTSEFRNLQGIDQWSQSYVMTPPKRIRKRLTGMKKTKMVKATIAKPAPSPKASPSPRPSPKLPERSPKGSPRA